MLICDNLPVRKSYFDSNIISNETQRYCDIFLWTILKRTSSEAHVYMRRHQGGKVEYFDVSDVIYHKFSHGAVSYTLNGKNVNVMLEYVIIPNVNISNMPIFLLKIFEKLLQCKSFSHYFNKKNSVYLVIKS